MVSHSKISSRKRGTARLPIRKLGSHRNAPPEPAPVRVASGPAVKTTSDPVPQKTRSEQPIQDLPVEPPHHFNLSEERLLTVKEAAYRLGKSSSIIREWLHCGRLRGWQPGGPRCSLMVSEVSLEEVLVQPLRFRN